MTFFRKYSVSPYGRRHRLRKFSAALLLTAVLAPSLINALAQAPRTQRPRPTIRPQIPLADRNAGKQVFIEHADEMEKLNDTFIILRGDVQFSKGAMLMFCDSAYYYPDSESMDAFSNVRMEQGDTLFIYADELNYNGREEVAYLYSNGEDSVRLINKDVMLKTPVFVYDLGIDLGYYNVGGVLSDKQNRLRSLEGEYVPSTKEANFYNNVILNSISEKDTLDIYTDTLYYNTDTHIAELYSFSRIVNSQAIIYTVSGTYNTETNIADLYERSMVKTNNNNTLMGDTLFYDRNRGYGEAWGNVEMIDSAKKASLLGDYGFYNELTDSSYFTGHALAMEYSKGDTLYLHGKQIQTFRAFDTIRIKADTILGIDESVRIDTTNVLVAYPRVRFFRSDMQGLCDSMRFESRDTTLHMYVHPIVWSGERQIFGNVIDVHFNDSTIVWARLPEFGMSAEHVDEEFYQQLSGKEMMAYFDEQGEMRHLDVSGNVMAVFLPMENDSTYNKIFNIESSFLSADFERREIQKMKFWPQNNTIGTPLFLARRSSFYLPMFKWYAHLRPMDPMDVFNFPEGMEELLNSEEVKPGRMTRTVTSPGSQKNMALSLPDSASRAEAIRNAVAKEMEEYPESRLRDIYKNFYQDNFGPGHLLADTAAAASYIRSELAATEAFDGPLYEPTGYKDNFYRVNLSVIADSIVPFPVFFNAFVRSINGIVPPSDDEWRDEWKEIADVINQMDLDLEDAVTDNDIIAEKLAKGDFQIHHSDAFNKNYNFHYRIISRDNFNKDILPLIEKKNSPQL